ncbi:MAG: hypothetical protein HBSAPP03_05450 [Phycisphaerae bacterium]|nr:MAG: hypothetical protein HBSAPP03_05450 [Phycisphaerae bacterium]
MTRYPDWNPFLHDEPPPENTNARRHGRLMCQDIGCSLGTVLDLSAGGVRIRCNQGAPTTGEIIGVILSAFEQDMTLTCVVRWVRRAGLFRREAGLEFMDLTPEQRRVLTNLARACAHNETVRYRRTDAA